MLRAVGGRWVETGECGEAQAVGVVKPLRVPLSECRALECCLR